MEENRTNINWYPGHMAKTKRQIIEDMKLIDVVIELLDSRIPISSQNPNIAEITKNKKKIIVLNKCDLSDEKQNKLWVEYFKSKNIPAVLVDSNSGKGIDNFIKEVEKIMQVDLEQHAQKGRTGRKIRAIGENLSEFDIIINTVPHLVLTEERLQYVKKDCLLVDLASNPGGIDKRAAKDKNLKLIWALALPGKVAPVTTAEFIKDTVYNILKEIYKK